MYFTALLLRTYIAFDQRMIPVYVSMQLCMYVRTYVNRLSVKQQYYAYVRTYNFVSLFVLLRYVRTYE